MPIFECSFKSCDATMIYRNCSKKLALSVQPSLDLNALCRKQHNQPSSHSNLAPSIIQNKPCGSELSCCSEFRPLPSEVQAVAVGAVFVEFWQICWEAHRGQRKGVKWMEIFHQCTAPATTEQPALGLSHNGISFEWKSECLE